MYRRPEYTDISVECGTTSISLFILLCPVVFTGYNESDLILNEVSNNPQCEGTYDKSASPPYVVRFNFPLNMSDACGSVFKTTSTAGTGTNRPGRREHMEVLGMLDNGWFFGTVNTVNVSGLVRSQDPTTGTVTYNTELKYYFSCAYPLEYLINNTRLDV
ncbi:hypothetical protein CRUP_037537 [Coryphaenoides rupestris]|nr:hypothetical protein CRUP_037537 [Coryphaenoides rupestris]